MAGEHVPICYNPRLTLMKTIVVLALCALAAFAGPFDRKKKKSEEDATQVLQLPKDPPSAVVAETARLGFYVSPLSSKGPESQARRPAVCFQSGSIAPSPAFANIQILREPLRPGVPESPFPASHL